MILQHFKRLADYHHKRTVCSTYPIVGNIEITNDCNLNCKMCPRDKIVANRGVGYMTFKQFKSLVDRYKPLMNNVDLFGHGEPTLHSDLPKMVNYVRLHGASRVGITSNGLLLTSNMFKTLVKFGLTDLTFSFEGVNPEIYEEIRSGSHYDVVLKNLKECYQINNGLDKPIKLTVNVLDMPFTNILLPSFLSNFKGYNVRKNIADDWSRQVGGTFFDRTYSQVCTAPWGTIMIHWDGGVAPCCRWIGERHFNLFNGDNIYDFWNGSFYRNFRERMLYGRANLKFCCDCKVDGFVTDFYRMPQSLLFPLSLNFFKLLIKRLA